jgi:hopanoid biosynthesis associated RND transporter like protein HpnN
MIIGRWVGRTIAITAQACGRRPITIVLVAAVLAVAGLLYTLHALGFVTSHLRLLPQHERYVVLLKEYQQDFGELNDLVVVVEAPAPALAKDYAAHLVEALGRVGVESSRITYRIDPAYFESRGLLYLSVDELTRLRDRLFDSEEFVESYAARPTLPQLLAGLNQQIANAMVLGFFDVGLGGGGKATDLRFLEAVLDQISARLDGTAPYTSPWSTAFSVGRLDEPDAGYYFSSDKHWLFLFVKQPRQEGSFIEARRTIETIRRAIAGLGRDFPEIRAGVTGSRAISNDEMATAFDDSKLATLLALAFTLGLLVLAYRRVGTPLLMVGTLVVSLLWSLGIITLVVGHLSIFSVMFISIVVGIGIDYGVYFLYRYQEERALGADPAAALGRTGERAGPGMVLGALTAAGAFVVLMLTDFQGIREFGLVSATAILLAFVSMVTLFPALLALGERRAGRGAALTGAAAAPARWLERLIGPRRTILLATLALTGFAVWGALQVDFGYNMLKLQAAGVESVLWEERIVAKAGRSGFAALATAGSLDELRRKQDALAALPSVSKVDSILMLVPDRQAEKIKLIQQFAPIVESVQVKSATALDPADLLGPLRTLQRRLNLATEESSEEVQREVAPAKERLDALLNRLVPAVLRQAGPGLQDLQGQIGRDFADKLRTFQKSLTPRPIVPGDAPPELQNRYVGTSGRYLLRIHPAVDIWQRAGAERFVTDLRRVDPDVTGPPVTSFEAIAFIRSGYFQGTLYALGLVTVVTAIMLRSALGTLLALTPLGLAALWTVGFMHVLELEFNLANVWALPLILGTAAEFGLNIYVRFQEGRETGGPRLAQSTVMAVVLNGLTTMAGFASLMVAHHRGIFGLGLLLTVGMTATLIAALIVLPVLLQLFYGPRTPDASYASEGVSGDATVSG